MKLRVQPSKPARIAKPEERERISRHGTVAHWDFEVSVHAADRSFFEMRSGGPKLIARGDFTEPVNGRVGFEVMLSESGDVNPERAHCLGFVISAKPALDCVVYFTSAEIGALTQFAASGRSLHLSMTFQKPRYGSAEIYSMAFSTTPPEQG